MSKNEVHNLHQRVVDMTVFHLDLLTQAMFHYGELTPEHYQTISRVVESLIAKLAAFKTYIDSRSL